MGSDVGYGVQHSRVGRQGGNNVMITNIILFSVRYSLRKGFWVLGTEYEGGFELGIFCVSVMKVAPNACLMKY